MKKFYTFKIMALLLLMITMSSTKAVNNATSKSVIPGRVINITLPVIQVRANRINLGKASKPQSDYVLKHYKSAQKEMELHGVPASITLAQGLLESDAGRSKLARKANNHFGITCSNKSQPYIIAEKGRRFRKYDTVAQSFRDHSLLLNKSRYKSLHKYKDYKSWSYGLKRCGYAEDPKYPQKLIGLIKGLNLDQFDT